MENPILKKLAMRLLVLALVTGAYGLGISYGMNHMSNQYANGDLNHDGKVDAYDLSILLKEYQAPSAKNLTDNGTSIKYLEQKPGYNKFQIYCYYDYKNGSETKTLYGTFEQFNASSKFINITADDCPDPTVIKTN